MPPKLNNFSKTIGMVTFSLFIGRIKYPANKYDKFITLSVIWMN